MIEMTRRELVRGLAAGTVVAMTGPALSGCRLRMLLMPPMLPSAVGRWSQVSMSPGS